MLPARIPLHVLGYGDFGAGKSTFADTFPNPKLVACFDAYGKDMPYYKNPLHVLGDLQVDGFGGPYREVFSKKTGAVLKRIEYYHDTTWLQPTEIRRKAGIGVRDIAPTAYARFLKRMASFDDELSVWRTLIADSVTSMELRARHWDQYVLNPQAEDGRQWYGASKDMLEKMLLGRLAGLPINVVVLAHIDDEKFEHQGTSRRMPMAPGKLRGSLPSQYGEVYRVFADADGHWLQTRSDSIWAATTQIGAPAICTPHYAALWESWDGASEQAAAEETTA